MSREALPSLVQILERCEKLSIINVSGNLLDGHSIKTFCEAVKKNSTLINVTVLPQSEDSQTASDHELDSYVGSMKLCCAQNKVAQVSDELDDILSGVSFRFESNTN